MFGDADPLVPADALFDPDFDLEEEIARHAPSAAVETAPTPRRSAPSLGGEGVLAAPDGELALSPATGRPEFRLQRVSKSSVARRLLRGFGLDT